jgi:segregation and condensation protein B
MKKEEITPIVDALIFAAEAPISMHKIKQILDEESSEPVSLKDIRDILDAIDRSNREQERGFFLQEVAGGYQYRTRPHYSAWIKRLKKVRLFRLTQSTLETLAIIAYKQPIIRAEIEKIRGVDSGGVLKNLLERALIKIVGRKNIAGRPFMFGTTSRFLEVFGLEKLADLPSLKDFDAFDESQLPTMLRQQGGEEIYIDDEAPDEESPGQQIPDADFEALASDYNVQDHDPAGTDAPDTDTCPDSPAAETPADKPRGSGDAAPDDQ